MQPGRRVDPVGVHRHDVGVLEPGKGLGLARALACDLQGHGPIRELPLASQEDAGERSPPQLLDQVEPADRLAGLGKRNPDRPAGSWPERPRPRLAGSIVDVEAVAEPISR